MLATQQIPMFTFDVPSMPKLDTSRCIARVINYETAANMVKTYHYAHRVPSIVVAIGMYVDDVLAGCITYGTMPTNVTSNICGHEHKMSVLELTRLFIHDWAGFNCESWLIGKSFQVLKQQYQQYNILISYADTGASHTGYIYQATNWLYTGQVSRLGYKDKDGGDVNERTINDTRKGTHLQGSAKQRGWESYKQKPKHRYVYFLGSKRQRKELRKALRWPVLPYPKADSSNP